MALLGSGFLVTAISLLANRYAFDRASRVESQYAKDLKLVAELEKLAKKLPEAVLVRVAARARVRDEVMKRLVPSRIKLQLVLFIESVVVLFLAGIPAAVSDLPLWIRVTLIVLAWVLLLNALLIMPIGQGILRKRLGLILAATTAGEAQTAGKKLNWFKNSLVFMSAGYFENTRINEVRSDIIALREAEEKEGK